MERDTQYVKWQNSLKSAIVLENFDNIIELLDNTPTSNDIDVMSINLALIGEAIDLFEIQKHKLLDSMKNIQKSKQFVQAQKIKISNKILA